MLPAPLPARLWKVHSDRGIGSQWVAWVNKRLYFPAEYSYSRHWSLQRYLIKCVSRCFLSPPSEHTKSQSQEYTMHAFSFVVVIMCFVRALTLFTGTHRRRVLFSNFGKKTLIYSELKVLSEWTKLLQAVNSVTMTVQCWIACGLLFSTSPRQNSYKYDLFWWKCFSLVNLCRRSPLVD